MPEKVNQFGVFPVGIRHELWLNRPVARRRTFRPVHPRRGSSRPWLWLGLISAIALACIYLWRAPLFASVANTLAYAGELGPDGNPIPNTQNRPDQSFHGRTPEFPLQAMELSLPKSLEPASPLLPPMPPRPVKDIFETQVALVRQGISPGSIDGVIGHQTRAALRTFQLKSGLPITGELDPATRARLVLDVVPITAHVVTPEDLARLRILSDTWLGKSKQDKLDYETMLELGAEFGMCHPALLRRFNAALDWQSLKPGTTFVMPLAYYPPLQKRAAFARIYLQDRVLQVFDIRTNLLVHFPCSIAQHVDKRPLGRLEVAVIAENPNYTFDPAIFPESAEGRELGRKLVVPPGPNNPVGVAWIGLNRPGYGIHGTPEPEKVGRTESHGCFRLANWNAEYFLKLSWVTMPVYVEP